MNTEMMAIVAIFDLYNILTPQRARSRKFISGVTEWADLVEKSMRDQIE